MRGRWRAYLALGRVSNLPTVWTNVVAGVLLSGASPSLATVVALQGILSLFYVGGMFLNDAFDRDVDARERPERPLPSGLVSPMEVFAIGYGLLGLGVLLVGFRAPRLAPILSALALAAAIVVYDAWHKGNPVGPVTMGLCRALVYITAALAVSDRLAAPVILSALCLWAYLAGLTYVAKQESRGELRNVWPFVLLLAPFVYAAPLAREGVWALLYAAFLIWVGVAIARLRSGRPGRIPWTVAWLIAGVSLLDALLVARVGAHGTAFLAALGAPLTLFLQRYVRGT